MTRDAILRIPLQTGHILVPSLDSREFTYHQSKKFQFNYLNKFLQDFFGFKHTVENNILFNLLWLYSDAFLVPWNRKSADCSSFHLKFWVFSLIFNKFYQVFLVKRAKKLCLFSKEKCPIMWKIYERLWFYLFAAIVEDDKCCGRVVIHLSSSRRNLTSTYCWQANGGVGLLYLHHPVPCYWWDAVLYRGVISWKKTTHQGRVTNSVLLWNQGSVFKVSF